MDEKRLSLHGQWSSRLTFILAASAAAVGLGNIWKFPYLTGQNGGGLFVLIYLACVILMGLPLMMAEITLGRLGRRNPAGTFKEIAIENKRSKLWSWVGATTIIAGALILSYYCVIAGWSVAYFGKAIKGDFQHIDTLHAQSMFKQLIANPWQLIAWHSFIVISTIIVIAQGLEKGIERAVKYLFPCLIILLVVLIGYGITTGHFGEAFKFLFEPDFSEIKGSTILVAMGQAFFSLSIANGSILMYGAYVPRNISITSAAIAISLADTGIALAAGLAIFPIVFANGLSPSSGPGLIFESLPIAFGHMSLGYVFGGLFFLMLICAAFTSTISLLEPAVAWLVELKQVHRMKAAWVIGGIIWLLGILTVLSFNYWAEIKLFNLNCFELIDYLTANIMLPAGGFLTAIFVGWMVCRQTVSHELEIKKSWLFNCWRFSIRYLTPIIILIVFLHALKII